MEFLVSAKVLELAARVFKRMLKSKFKEGLAHRTPQKPLVLLLLEDDDETLKVLFHVLHFSSMREFMGLDLNLHLKLARLADRYDCIPAIRGESRRLLPNGNMLFCDPESIWTATTVAFIMGHEDIFQRSTAKLASMSEKTALEDHEIDLAFPDEFPGKQRHDNNPSSTARI